MRITRSATSSVPLEADSAVVRVWHPTAGTHALKWIRIPEPGASADVSFTLPARSGYSVGVIAYRRASFLREALAGGRADNVTITTDTAARVAVNVVPWIFSMTVPDTLYSGEQTSVAVTITQGPIADFLLVDTRLHLALTPWTNFDGLPTSRLAIREGNRATFTFAAPTVERDTTVWLQFNAMVSHLNWDTGNIAMFVFRPAFTFNESLITRPLKVRGGTLVVTFDDTRRRLLHGAADRVPATADSLRTW